MPSSLNEIGNEKEKTVKDEGAKLTPADGGGAVVMGRAHILTIT